MTARINTERVTTKSFFRPQDLMKTSNSLKPLRATKNLSANRLVIILFFRLCLDGLAAVKFLFEARPKHSWSVLKAHLHFYLRFTYFLKKRRLHTTKQSQYYHLRSVVWNYFLLGKRKFSELKD